MVAEIKQVRGRVMMTRRGWRREKKSPCERGSEGLFLAFLEQHDHGDKHDDGAEADEADYQPARR